MAPFSRLVRETLLGSVRERGGGCNVSHVTKECLECLHESSELYLLQFFQDLNLLTCHANRVTVMGKDITALKKLAHQHPGAILVNDLN